MKKSWIVIGVIVVLVFIIYRLFAGSYNNMVELNEPINKAWADVENAYQSRMDKTGVLVETVKGAANFEKSTLEAVIQARASATQVKIDPQNLTPEKVAAFQKAQEGFSSSLSRLLVVAEQYPELKATEAFRDFQSQYEGMENRIAVERRKFNEVVQAYNTYIRKFPSNLIAGMFGFEKKGYFEAATGANVAPKVDFKND
jgi:LemA protein